MYGESLTLIEMVSAFLVLVVLPALVGFTIEMVDEVREGSRKNKRRK